MIINLTKEMTIQWLKDALDSEDIHAEIDALVRVLEGKLALADTGETNNSDYFLGKYTLRRTDSDQCLFMGKLRGYENT